MESIDEITSVDDFFFSFFQFNVTRCHSCQVMQNDSAIESQASVRIKRRENALESVYFRCKF